MKKGIILVLLLAGCSSTVPPEPAPPCPTVSCICPELKRPVVKRSNEYRELEWAQKKLDGVK